MMWTRSVLALCWLLPMTSLAQPKKNNTPVHIISSVGSVAGESAARPQFQLSGGVIYSHFYTGIGVAYDRYQFSSVPVFADWRYHFGEKKVLFVYASSGYNLPAKYHKESEYLKTSDKMKGGFYMDAGAGCRFAVGKMHTLALSAGYSRKNMMRRRVYTYPCYLPGCDETETIYAYDYHFGRIVTKLSWEIGK